MGQFYITFSLLKASFQYSSNQQSLVGDEREIIALGLVFQSCTFAQGFHARNFHQSLHEFAIGFFKIWWYINQIFFIRNQLFFITIIGFIFYKRVFQIFRISYVLLRSILIQDFDIYFLSLEISLLEVIRCFVNLFIRVCKMD